MTPFSARPFLSAEWRSLAMLNYEVEPALLQPYIPPGTEPDSFKGRTFVSLVGFRFSNTKVFAIPIPFHRSFDEVNLRFYVRRRENGAIRRGVAFIREIVPRRAIAAVARLAYNEQYVRLRMEHTVSMSELSEGGIVAEYRWRLRRCWNRLYARASGEPAYPAEGSLEGFITEHYWGYAAQRRGGSLEYRVAHEPWRVWTSSDCGLEGDATDLYGGEIAAVLRGQPDSAFIAEGSPVTVFRGARIA